MEIFFGRIDRLLKFVKVNLFRIFLNLQLSKPASNCYLDLVILDKLKMVNQVLMFL